jgi:flagellar motor switch protein FliM
MTDALDQSDIDALLNAVDSADGGASEGGGTAHIFSRHRRTLEDVEIKPYDFKRPERISKDHMRALQTLHEAFARNFGASLSGFLRTIVEVTVAQVEQMTYSEFIDGLPNPTCFNLVEPTPLEGQVCLEVSPLIIYPIIDRLLGGSSQDLFIPQRPLTMIESRLVQRILRRGMVVLSESWEGVRKITFQLGEMESNPQLVQIVPPNEVVVVVRFELKMSKRAGTMSLCIPFNVIEPVMDALDAQSWFSSGRHRGGQEWEAQITRQLAQAGLRLSSILAETTMTVEDLRNLEVGDVLVTEKHYSRPVVMCVEGIPKFLGRIGQFKGKRAIQVLRSVHEDDRY